MMRIYVDDILLTTIDEDAIEDGISYLIKQFETITVNRGNKHDYLGINFDFHYTFVMVSIVVAYLTAT
jgi:hypothetical protein